MQGDVEMRKRVNPRFMLIVALIAILSGTALTAAAKGPREGWHGETMPEGLERGKKEGEYVWKKDGTLMVYVPPGPFTMGSDKGEVAEKPAHTVELDGFYIDKYEISWRKWKASGLPYLEGRDDRLQTVQAPDWGIHDGQPVVNVSWIEARKYTAWAGKRLPTEAEWEKAARGTDGREYPWGNEPITNERAISREHPISDISTAPVNCCQAGASPYGAVNMAGNVWEWCEDSYSPDYYASSPRRNPLNKQAGVVKIVRGGAMQLNSRYLHTYSRYWLSDVERISDVGFRTVVSGVAAKP
jgi:formylglycine-generating enzyme required for sulfatase activity